MSHTFWPGLYLLFDGWRLREKTVVPFYSFQFSHSLGIFVIFVEYLTIIRHLFTFIHTCQLLLEQATFVSWLSVKAAHFWREIAVGLGSKVRHGHLTERAHWKLERERLPSSKQNGGWITTYIFLLVSCLDVAWVNDRRRLESLLFIPGTFKKLNRYWRWSIIMWSDAKSQCLN